MLGYNEMTNQELNLGDPFKSGHNKLRPLVPRPYISPPSPTNHRLSLNTTTTRHHHHHHFGSMGPEEGKPEVVGTHQLLVSSRWNPTPEQLRALEDLYRRGTRTPSAEQIQHITSQLKRFGKIEGKNVFYWFQNHKARERQKRRRQHQPNSSEKGSNIGGKKDNVVESEQKSCKWAPSLTNKESDLTPETGVTKAATQTTSPILPQSQHNHVPNNHFHNDINNIKNLLLFSGEKNATWHTHNDTTTLVQNPFCSCCYPSLFPLSISSPKLINSSPSFVLPKTVDESRVQSITNGGNDNGDEVPESPTLQLFPLVHVKKDNHYRDDHDHKSSHDYDDGSNEKANVNNPFPYYHFL